MACRAAQLKHKKLTLTLLIIWFSAMLLWPNTGSVKFLNSEFFHGPEGRRLRAMRTECGPPLFCECTKNSRRERPELDIG
jgi:hypothetical protein